MCVCVCVRVSVLFTMYNEMPNSSFFCLFQVNAVADQCHKTGLRSDEPVDSGWVKFKMHVKRREPLGPCGIMDLQVIKYVEVTADATTTYPSDYDSRQIVKTKTLSAWKEDPNCQYEKMIDRFFKNSAGWEGSSL